MEMDSFGEEVFKIRIMIADRVYYLNIKRKDEERIRKAVKLIEERLNVYGSTNSQTDKEGYLSMVALDFAVNYLKLQEDNETKPLIDKLEELNETLEKYLE